MIKWRKKKTISVHRNDAQKKDIFFYIVIKPKTGLSFYVYTRGNSYKHIYTTYITPQTQHWQTGERAFFFSLFIIIT